MRIVHRVVSATVGVVARLLVEIVIHWITKEIMMKFKTPKYNGVENKYKLK